MSIHLSQRNTERVWQLEDAEIKVKKFAKKYSSIFFRSISLVFSFNFNIVWCSRFTFVAFLLSNGQGLFDRMVDQVLDLEAILRGRLLIFWQVSKLADQVAAVRQVFRGDKVNADWDTALKVFHLKKHEDRLRGCLQIT